MKAVLVEAEVDLAPAVLGDLAAPPEVPQVYAVVVVKLVPDMQVEKVPEEMCPTERKEAAGRFGIFQRKVGIKENQSLLDSCCT